MEKDSQESCRRGQERSRVPEEDAEFPWCLKLRKTPSLLALIESKLKEASEKGNEDLIAQRITEKPQVSIISADELQIGSWQRKSIRKGDLLAKIYYAKRKLVWEVSEGALRNKIEIQWSDVSAIRAHIVDDGRGMLEIELKPPPRFFLEDPQPRRASKWQDRDDFTGGEASICRLHSVFFPPGELDIHYEKLLQYDQRLFDLSKKPFPSHNYRYSHHKPFGFPPVPPGFSEYRPHGQLNYHVQNYPMQPVLPGEFSPIQITHPLVNVTEQMSRMSVAETPFRGSGGCSYTSDIPWDNRGVSNFLPGNANQNYPVRPTVRHEFPHDQRTRSHFDITNQNTLMPEIPFIDSGGCSYPNYNQYGNQGLNSHLQGYASQTYPSQPTLPQEFPHNQITRPYFNITNQNPLTYDEAVHLSDLLDREQEKASIICDYEQPIQSSPTFQIPDNDMNTSSNPHGQGAQGQG